MRLANGIVIDKEATFGALKFSALRREVHLQNEVFFVIELNKTKMFYSYREFVQYVESFMKG